MESLWRVAFIVAVLTLFGMGCSDQVGPLDPSSSGTGKTIKLTIFAAASLREAFNDIGNRFHADHPDVELVLNYAGSQQLAYQLSQGAPADVYASANPQQMAVAIREARVDASTSRPFAYNRLVVIYPVDNLANIQVLQDLATPGLNIVLAAEEVPVGRYSQMFLDNMSLAAGANFEARVLANVVSYEENVKAVLSKVILGEADAGIVYQSDVSSGFGDRVGVLPIPEQFNILAEYLIAPLRDSHYPEQARAFVDFILSPTGQESLATYGLIPTNPVTGLSR